MTKPNSAALLTLFQPTAAQLEKLRTSVRLRTARSQTEILIADVNEGTRQILSEMLRKNVLPNACKVYVAANAKEAWTQYFSYAPDICFLSLAMPEIDGYRLSRLLHTIDSAVKVVMITKADAPADGAKLKDSGAKGVITQPYDLHKVIAVVQKLVPTSKGAKKK